MGAVPERERDLCACLLEHEKEYIHRYWQKSLRDELGTNHDGKNMDIDYMSYAQYDCEWCGTITFNQPPFFSSFISPKSSPPIEFSGFVV